mgnify:CR=1 FL=1
MLTALYHIITLFTKNPEAAAIFGKMTRADLIASLSKATNLESSKIKSVLNSMNMPSYIDKVLGRQKFLKDFLAELKKTPQTGMDNITYIKKVMGQTLENSINQAKTIDDLVDIKQALMIIK